MSKDSTCLVSTLDLDTLYTFRTVKWRMSNIDFYFFTCVFHVDVKYFSKVVEFQVDLSPCLISVVIVFILFFNYLFPCIYSCCLKFKWLF